MIDLEHTSQDTICYCILVSLSDWYYRNPALLERLEH